MKKSRTPNEVWYKYTILMPVTNFTAQPITYKSHTDNQIVAPRLPFKHKMYSFLNRRYLWRAGIYPSTLFYLDKDCDKHKTTDYCKGKFTSLLSIKLNTNKFVAWWNIHQRLDSFCNSRECALKWFSKTMGIQIL